MIEVYTSPSCPKCAAIKMYLDAQKVNYLEKSVTVEKFMGELVAQNILTVPVVKYGDKICTGFNKKFLDGVIQDVRCNKNN
ncbi:hypothetical protein vBCtySFA88_00045 [Clostridium phage vB_CtyS-FA88]|nr:hypothetical protein vBCtySFA88_00045 [Clostridium phage vB_CtyS-FA88]